MSNSNIYKTSKSDTRPKHSHLIYIKELDDGSFEGVTTDSNSHIHEVVFNEGGVEMKPAGKSLHTHQIEDSLEFTVEEIKSGDDVKRKSEIKTLIEESSELEEESVKKAEESEDFYAGKQWTDVDKQKMMAEDRPAITINEISSKIDLLCGFQRQNRTDIRFFPVESSDAEVSQIATEAVNNVFDSNNLQVSESEVFKDEASVGRGIYHTYVDYDKNVFGSIVVERLNWNAINFGPHEKVDLSDCEYIVKQATIPVKKLKMMYPEKADEISSMYARAEEIEFRSEHTTIAGLEYRNKGDNTYQFVDVNRQTIIVKEIWEKNYIVAHSIVNYDDGFVDTVTGLTKEQIKGLESLGFDVIRRTMNNMRVTICINDVILDEKIEDQDFFPVIPVYAKRTSKGMFYGKIEDVKDIQREINKRHSQSLDVVNRVSSYGYFYDDQTFQSKAEENQWKQDVSRPGFTAKVKDLGKIPTQTQGVRMPTDLVGMAQMASEKLLGVMNISPEALGFANREVSSVAIIEQRRNVLTANEFLFDNLAQAKRLLSMHVLSLIRKTYSVDRLMRLIGNQNPETPEDMEKLQRQEQAANRLLNDVGLEDLDVSVDISADSPTTRSANFSLLLELSKSGTPIPPEIVIESSDLPNKNEIISIITGQAQAKAASEKEKFDTEREKVILSKLEPAQLQEYIGQQQGGQTPAIQSPAQTPVQPPLQ